MWSARDAAISVVNANTWLTIVLFVMGQTEERQLRIVRVCWDFSSRMTCLTVKSVTTNAKHAKQQQTTVRHASISSSLGYSLTVCAKMANMILPLSFYV